MGCTPTNKAIEKEVDRIMYERNRKAIEDKKTQIKKEVWHLNRPHKKHEDKIKKNRVQIEIDSDTG